MHTRRGIVLIGIVLEGEGGFHWDNKLKWKDV